MYNSDLYCLKCLSFLGAFSAFRFRLIKEHLIEFNQLAMANAEGSDEMLNRVMTKDNIGLAALLETREGVFESSGGKQHSYFIGFGSLQFIIS